MREGLKRSLNWENLASLSYVIFGLQMALYQVGFWKIIGIIAALVGLIILSDNLANYLENKSKMPKDSIQRYENHNKKKNSHLPITNFV